MKKKDAEEITETVEITEEAVDPEQEIEEEVNIHIHYVLCTSLTFSTRSSLA